MSRNWSVLAAVAVWATAGAFAQTPVDGAFTYQGQLKDEGQPVSGPYDMQFRLYAADTGGTPLATYPPGGPMAVTAQDGLFTTVLDFGTETFNGERRWLEVVVEGVTLAPRQELTVTPYALYALNGPGGESFWEQSGSDIYYDAGNVGIGISTPNARLNAYTFGATAVMGQSGSGLGVYGVSSTNSAVMGYNTTSGTIGKLGDPTYAVYGEKPDGFAGYFAGDVHVTGDLTLDGVFNANAWSLTGNAGTDPNVDFLGTTDNQPLVLKVNGDRVMRLEPTAISPNVIAGFVDNQVLTGVVGATIGGGGMPDDGFGDPDYNWVRAHYGTIAGGASNRAGAGSSPGDGQYATVGGGSFCNASGEWSTVAGGHSNWAGGGFASIPGGFNVQAGGDYSFAAGLQAKVRSPAESGDPDGDEGTFVWADASEANSDPNDPNSYFTSTGPNQFLVRATGGIDLNVDISGGGLRLEPTASSPNMIAGARSNEVAPGVVGATIAGGAACEIDGNYGVVGGGYDNETWGLYATVTGGSGNTAQGEGATISGGTDHTAEGERSTIAGGYWNGSPGAKSTIGGGQYNLASGEFATVAGGGDNAATGVGSTVGGGHYNAATGQDSTVGGGYLSDAAGYFSTVGGGHDNDATADYSTVGGGYSNDAAGYFSTVGGGRSNDPTGDYSTVGGGYDNEPTGVYSTVGGGYGNTADGDYGTVPGGRLNAAGGDDSFAAGRRAKVRNAAQAGDADGDEGTFVWADSTDADFTSTGPDQFLVRAAGGVGINTNSPSNDLTVDGDADFTGNVGLGTNSPTARLEVVGNLAVRDVADTKTLGLRTSGGALDIDFLDASLYISSETGLALYINHTTRNVGVGVASPSETLDVNGTARVRGLGTSTGTTVVADANGKLWKLSSSLRYKSNVADLPTAGDAVLDLRPVSFDWNSTGDPDIGLIAEEVEQVLPDLVIRDADGRPDGVRYDKVALYLVGVVKDQRGQLAMQEDQIATQQAQIEAQQDELTNLRARLEKIEALLAEHVAQPTGGVR